MRPYKMVRGLCPRDMIHEVVNGVGRAVGNMGAVGHADYPQPANRGRHATQGERGGGVARGTSAVRRPTAAHRGRCALRREVNRSATNPCCPSSGGRGVEDAAPYGGCVWVCFSGAVRWAELMVCDCRHPLRSMPQRSFCCQLVGRTVLGAPRLRDCRGNVGADGRRDRLHPCFLRCAR